MNTIEKLIAQHDKILGRKELKTCKIYSKELDVEFTAKQLDREDMLDIAQIMESDNKKGINTFIYLSLAELQDEKLLKAYKISKGDCSAIVETLFTNGEKVQIVEILEDLNDMIANPLAIVRKDIDDLAKK
jgi:hypothetical protein|nr:MAG TPA: hypothetical protein [Caudoviricetes sp.]